MPPLLGLSLLCVLALAGCTTVGVRTSAREQVDFGPPVTVRVCVLKAADITPHRAEVLKQHVQTEFAQYGLRIEVPWVREWERPGFQVGSIMHDLLQRPLEPPCDRLFGFVDRHPGDFAWGLVLPEVLGAVDDVTATRGYVVATFGSLNQIFLPPGHAIVHEFCHLFGCPHDFTLTKCYPKIATLKAAVQPDADFFPGVSRWRPEAEGEQARAGKGKGGAAPEAQETVLPTRAGRRGDCGVFRRRREGQAGRASTRTNRRALTDSAAHASPVSAPRGLQYGDSRAGVPHDGRNAG